MNIFQINALLTQNRILQDENDKLTQTLHTALNENTNMAEKALLVSTTLYLVLYFYRNIRYFCTLQLTRIVFQLLFMAMNG